MPRQTRKQHSPAQRWLRFALALALLGSPIESPAAPATEVPDSAHPELLAAAAAAEAVEDPKRAASLWNDLGRLEAGEGRYAEATDRFSRAVRLAATHADSGLEVRARANRARALLDLGLGADVAADLDAAVSLTASFPASAEQALLLLNLARSYERYRALVPERGDAAMLRAHSALRRALEIADEVGDERSAGFALGYMGELYALDGRRDDAVLLTRRALLRAEALEARDTQHLWHAQLGALLRTVDQEASLSAYREAVEALETLRPGVSDLYGPAGRSFRRERGRIHRELVDVLLSRAPGLGAPAQQTLLEAQRILELLKADELRDYFEDDCVDAFAARRAEPAALSPSARVIYPVLLPEWTAILVSGPRGIRLYRAPVPTEELEGAVRQLRREIANRMSFGFLSSAGRLHEWLIEPIQSELGDGVDTLVFVPDGVLREVPPAVFHDGKRFLIERFSLAVTPGLELTDPRPLDPGSVRVFLGGLSEGVQGFPPLAHVRGELEAIRELYPGETLLDAAFTAARLERGLAEAPFSVVHVATHAQFRGRNSDTFLLTFDGRISLDEFMDQIGRFRFRDQPLELLALSACETAKGDELASLGLAGLAIKAGARSALATLWQVNDEAAALLMASVYRNLLDPTLSRAEALRKAQLAMLGDRRYRHPYYWAPFLLIGNWL